MPGITLVEPPCQVIVQPPAWLPMLSALLPGDVDVASASRSGSARCRVLEQHLRLGHRLAGDARGAPAADLVDVAAVGERVLEQAELELLRSGSADRVVDPAHRDAARR